MIESGLALHVCDDEGERAVRRFARLLEGEARSEVLQEMVEGMQQERGEMRGVVGKTLNWWLRKHEVTGGSA